MKCKKCGYELKDEWKICPQCHEVLEEKNRVNTKKLEDENKKEITKKKEDNKSNEYIGAYLLIFFLSLLLGIFISEIRWICLAISFITIITAHIKLPNSKVIKVIFWLYIIGIIIYILYILFILFLFVKYIPEFLDSLSSCPG